MFRMEAIPRIQATAVTPPIQVMEVIRLIPATLPIRGEARTHLTLRILVTLFLLAIRAIRLTGVILPTHRMEVIPLTRPIRLKWMALG